MSIENSYALKEHWLPQIDMSSHRIDDVFLRRSEAIELGDRHTVQIVLVTPPGLNEYNREINLGYALPHAGLFPIKHLFQNFGKPRCSDLSLSIKIENSPKKGKGRSGDMPAVVVLCEKNNEVERFVILNILVDNLSTDSNERYGMFKVRADSYSSECQSDSLVNGSEKFIYFAKYMKENVNNISAGRYGLLFNDGNIPDSSIEFRNNVLGLFSDQLPDSPNYSEKSRGIYCVSVSDISFVPHLGFTGQSILLRSNADITAVINNDEVSDHDDHKAAEAVARSLKATSSERYKAKLSEGIYDVCGPNYENYVGGFEISKYDVFDDEGFYIASDEKYGNVNHSVILQSDGYNKGSDLDDVSRTQVKISGYYFG